MNQEAQRQWYAEEGRHLAKIKRIIRRFPEYRAHFGYAILGAAVATCDSFGLDVEGWIAELRKREPKPDVLVPRKGEQS